MPVAAPVLSDAEDGVIEVGKSYWLPVFMHKARISKHALASAKKAGLKVRYHGNRGFVLGSDWLDFLASRPAGSR